MGKLRDRWSDRGPVDDPVAELDRLAGRLREKEQVLAFAEEQVVDAEEAEKALAGFAEELFAGTLAPDEHDRRRAEITHTLTTTRRYRDDMKEVVEAGKRACEAQHERICEQRREQCDTALADTERDLAETLNRVRQLESLTLVIAERRRSYSHGEAAWLRLRARFDRRTAERLEEERQRLPLLPPETVDEQRKRVVDTTLATRAADPDTGLPVPAYVLLPSGDDNGAVRIG